MNIKSGVILFMFLSMVSCHHHHDIGDTTKTVVATSDAPEAIGPYSQGIRTGRLLFISGQIPIEPESGSIVADDIGQQTRQVLKNIGAILAAAGLDYRDVVNCSVFLTDLDDFGEMNRIYADYFQENPPARATVEVSRLPRDVRVEISAIAYFP